MCMIELRLKTHDIEEKISSLFYIHFFICSLLDPLNNWCSLVERACLLPGEIQVLGFPFPAKWLGKCV